MKGYVEQDGVRYSWSGWYGSQLRSREWRRPPAGTSRNLTRPGHTSIRIEIVHTRRVGLTVECAWSVQQSGCTFSGLDVRIRALCELCRTAVAP